MRMLHIHLSTVVCEDLAQRKRKCDAGQSNSLFVTCTASVSHAYVRLIGQRHTSAFASIMQDLRKQLYESADHKDKWA